MKTALEIIACAVVLGSCLVAAVLMAGGSILLTALRKFDSKDGE